MAAATASPTIRAYIPTILLEHLDKTCALIRDGGYAPEESLMLGILLGTWAHKVECEPGGTELTEAALAYFSAELKAAAVPHGELVL